MYFSDFDEDSKKNENKKVRNIIKKIENDKMVYGCIPIEYMKPEEQVKVLHMFLEEINDRQIIDNLKKTDVDKSYKFEIIDEEKHIQHAEICYYPVDMDSLIRDTRQQIRYVKEDRKKLLENLIKDSELITRMLLTEYACFESEGSLLVCIENIYKYITYVENVILQVLNYFIIVILDIDTSNIFKVLLEHIKQLSEQLDIQLDQIRHHQCEKNVLNADFVMKYFNEYINHRNEFYERIDIYSVLNNEMKDNKKLFDNVPEEYQAPKIILSEKEIKSIKEIITEGKSVSDYENKMNKVREFIDINRMYYGRDCYSNCLQDLKVYFREIYMSKATYRRQQAHTIVKNFIQEVNDSRRDNKLLPEFEKRSQYMFIREKISRGYFREKGLQQDYLNKIEFTSEFYELLLKTYWFCDDQIALIFIENINRELLETIYHFF